jgi:hypothetical protein
VFGRLKEQPSPQSQVGASASPVTTAAADDDGGGGPREGLILLLFTIVTVALSAYVLTGEEHDAVHDPAQKASRGEIKGLDQQSLLREPNLRRALAKIENSPRPLVSNIRVSAVRVDVTSLDNDGSRKIVSIDPGFKVTQNDFGVGEDASVRTTQIDAGAPERMVRAVAERTRLGAGAVDYVAMSFSGTGERSWYMSLDQGPARTRSWIAAADGSDLRKPGELSRAQKDADAKRKRKLEAEQRRFQRQAARRSACLSKATSAIAAARCVQRFPL